MAGFSTTTSALKWIPAFPPVMSLACLLLAIPGVTSAQAFASSGEEAPISIADSVATDSVQQEAVQQEAAQQKVELFHAALMRSARSESGFALRASIVETALDAVFDIERIARISAGRAWRDLNDTTKAEYVDLLRDVVVSAYVSRFDADRGQNFETLATERVRSQRYVVKTRITRLDGKAVSLDYYFRDGLVFNVVADGVSDLSLRRADYAAIVKANGFDGLLQHLRAQVVATRESVDPGPSSDNPDDAPDDGA